MIPSSRSSHRDTIERILYATSLLHGTHPLWDTSLMGHIPYGTHPLWDTSLPFVAGAGHSPSQHTCELQGLLAMGSTSQDEWIGEPSDGAAECTAGASAAGGDGGGPAAGRVREGAARLLSSGPGGRQSARRRPDRCRPARG